VVYATERGNRPRQTIHSVPKQRSRDTPAHDPSCPFCRGNEAQTPPTLFELPDPLDSTAGAWGLRVVNNKFPAVDAACGDGEDDDAFDYPQLTDACTINSEIPATGRHEVLIESSRHNYLSATESLDTLALLVRAWVARSIVAAEDPRVKLVMCFKNQGGTAGASLIHPHSQLIALPLIPRQVSAQLHTARDFYVQHGKSAFANMARQELDAGTRVIEQNEHFLAFVPFAAICPFETWILPRPSYQRANFHLITSDEEASFGKILHRCLRRIHHTLDEPNFNLLLRSGPIPNRGRSAAYRYESFYSWHCRVIPRLGAGAMAGFEFGSGIFSNANRPENDAEVLRKAPINIFEKYSEKNKRIGSLVRE